MCTFSTVRLLRLYTTTQYNATHSRTISKIHDHMAHINPTRSRKKTAMAKPPKGTGAAAASRKAKAKRELSES